MKAVALVPTNNGIVSVRYLQPKTTADRPLIDWKIPDAIHDVRGFFEDFKALVLKSAEALRYKESLTEADVSVLFSIPQNTLRTKRCRKEGPKYVKAGSKVLYRREDIDDYLRSRLVQTRP